MTSWTMEKRKRLRLLSLASQLLESSIFMLCWDTKMKKKKQFKLFIIQQLLRQDTVLRGRRKCLEAWRSATNVLRLSEYVFFKQNNNKHAIERWDMNNSRYSSNLIQVTSSLRRGWVSRFTVQFFHFHQPLAIVAETVAKTPKMNAWTWGEQID